MRTGLKLKPTFLILFALTFLLGCKAEELELRISTKQISEAIKGNAQEVRFQAEFAILSDYNDEIKRTIKQIREISEKYADIEEFDVTQGDFGLKIEVDGHIPLISPNVKSSKSPWVLLVEPNPDKGALNAFSHKLTFGPSDGLSGFLAELQKINFMLTLETFQPVKFKIRNNTGQNLRIFTGGVEVDGQSRVTYETTVTDRISLSMSGGVYDNASAVLYLTLN